MSFAQNLKKLMSERKLSAYKMANDLHCSQTTIRNWVDGKTTPQPRTIIQLCEYFEVDEAELMGSPEVKKNSPDTVSSAEAEFDEDFINTMRLLDKRQREIVKSLAKSLLTSSED